MSKKAPKSPSPAEAITPPPAILSASTPAYTACVKADTTPFLNPVSVKETDSQMSVEEPATIVATQRDSVEAYFEQNAGLICKIILSVFATIVIAAFADVMVFGTDDEFLKNAMRVLFVGSKCLFGYLSVFSIFPILPLLVIADSKGEFKCEDEAQSSGNAATSSTNASDEQPSGSNGTSLPKKKVMSYSESAALSFVLSLSFGCCWLLNVLLLMWWDARYDLL